MRCLICENEMECLDDGYRVGYTREIYECDNCEALTEVYYSKNNYGSKDGRKISTDEIRYKYAEIEDE